jgi:lipopolysaccharide transport system permease protein
LENKATLLPGRAPSEKGVPQTIVIEAKRGWVPLNLRELLSYRDLLFFLAWRDITIRYKQTILGASWAIIQPFSQMVVFSIFFGLLIHVPSDGVPYPVFSYVALLPWQYFSTALSQSADSLVNNQGLISKIYFPRLIIPLASVLPALLDFVLAFSIMILLFVIYHVTPTWNVIWLPVFLLIAMITALAVGLWISALNVMYRDFRYVVPFVIQLWFYTSPVAYSSSVVPEQWRALYSLNPLVGIIEGFRWALLGTGNFSFLQLTISTSVTLVVLISGAYFLRRMERTFADVV